MKMAADTMVAKSMPTIGTDLPSMILMIRNPFVSGGALDQIAAGLQHKG